ncbi:FUSC family protein [Paracidovorax anthurii]|uniref:Putative membrane protein YccC n=1 Tax=Paracidovorax anthurii TaxID=78229 RepID=A0A328ZV51_9BURK|nr:FUSC family protein [Paracidovorax anthurii]RAR86146.1 putative membrane protein YccC [Paracidovorax anthurii]
MRSIEHRLRAITRVALSHYVANGLSVALGLLLVSALVHAWLGAAAAAAASVGVVACSPPDLPGPRRGKLLQMLPAPLLGIPLFFAVQWLYASPLRLGLLLVPGTFLAFLLMAWGKRGIPVAVAVMFSMVFSMAAVSHGGPQGDPLPAALAITGHFALGAGLYLAYALAANRLLNARYRVQSVADVLLSLAALMRVQARQFDPAPRTPEAQAPGAGSPSGPAALMGQLLLRQAALAEQLQSARNIVLESPTTPARQRLAGMLLLVLEMRDHLLACELDVDVIKAHPGHVPVLNALRGVLHDMAREVARLADALLRGRQPAPFTDRRPALAQLRWSDAPAPEGPGAGPSPHAMARSLADRIGHINDEALRMIAMARGEAAPDLAVVRASWQMFVSPTAWSWAPLATLWRWDAPPLRHALRAALAMATGFVLAQALPWGTHAYWMLLTIVVVLRGSLAQTLERRNSRVAGTLLGCVLAAGLLAAHLSALQLIVCLTLAQAVAHGFAVRRYLATAVAATVLGLVQSHMLHGGASPAFDLLERLADTFIGTGIAWAFSYVLPSWERSQIPALVARTLAAQARHAREALALGQLQAVDNAPELAWRLARREAYDSLSALVQATQRSLAEPRAVQPPLEALERLQARCYQLLAQLTAVKTLLLLRRGRLDAQRLQAPLEHAAQAITHLLEGPAQAVPPQATSALPADDAQLWPDPQEGDLWPWMVRRLALAVEHAGQVRTAASEATGQESAPG